MKLVFGMLDDAKRWVIKYFKPAGYGEIGLNAPASISDFTSASWVEIPMDSALILDPRGVTYDLPSNSVSAEYPGIWLLLAKVSLTFDEVNSGRELRLRLYNKTQGAPGDRVFVDGVGRNVGTGTVRINSLISEFQANINDEYVLQVSGDSSFTNVNCIGATFGVTYQSESRFL